MVSMLRRLTNHFSDPFTLTFLASPANSKVKGVEIEFFTLCIKLRFHPLVTIQKVKKSISTPFTFKLADQVENIRVKVLEKWLGQGVRSV